VKGSRRAAAALTAAKTMTFAAAAHIAAHAAGLTAKSTEQWTASLERYAYPVIGAIPVADIDTSLVLKVIEPIWTSKTETAARVRARIEKILDWAKVRGYREGENPARLKGHIDPSICRAISTSSSPPQPPTQPPNCVRLGTFWGATASAIQVGTMPRKAKSSKHFSVLTRELAY
jgi:hypothetical protein